MPVYSRTYYGFPGRTYITDPLLSNVTLLHVARQGVSQWQTFNETISDNQYIYSSFSGTISFKPDVPFLLGTGLYPIYRNMERILVIWKV